MGIDALAIVPHCDTYSDGIAVAAFLLERLCAGERVFLSFNGVNSVPSSFVNGAFIPLLNALTLDQIKRNLVIVDSTKQINSMIRDEMEAASRQPRPRVNCGSMQAA